MSSIKSLVNINAITILAFMSLLVLKVFLFVNIAFFRYVDPTLFFFLIDVFSFAYEYEKSTVQKNKECSSLLFFFIFYFVFLFCQANIGARQRFTDQIRR